MGRGNDHRYSFRPPEPKPTPGPKPVLCRPAVGRLKATMLPPDDEHPTAPQLTVEEIAAFKELISMAPMLLRLAGRRPTLRLLQGGKRA